MVLVLGQVWLLNRGLREEFLAIQQDGIRRELELAPLFLRGAAEDDESAAANDQPAAAPEQGAAVPEQGAAVPEQGAAVPGGGAGTADLDASALFLSRRIGYPVTLLDESGRVMGASSDLPFQMRGLVVPLEGTELQAALAGDVGFALRRGSGDVEVRMFGATRVRFTGRTFLLQVAAPLDGVRRAVRARIWTSTALVVPGLLLALVLTVLLGRAIARPLNTLSRRARGLAAGNFSRRMPRTLRIREVDELAGTFNRLAEELEGRYRSIEGERDEMQALIDCMGEAVIAVTEDARVLRANRAAIELLDFPDPVNFAPVGTLIRQPQLRSLLESAVVGPFSAREVTVGDRILLVSARPVDGGGAVVSFLDITEVRRLERVRRDFVANASHELKTPLTAMRGFAETLLDDDPPENLRREFLASIRANTLRLQHLVEDLLDLSRFESGSWMAKRDQLWVRRVVDGVRRDFADRLEERRVSLAQEGDALVLADDQGMEQVLKNLVDNAIRYSPEGGTITVEVVPGNDREVRVTVRDTGVGIPSSALTRVFERFYRVDPARSRAEGGTGLGLAIVRHLVQAMGGEVWAESELGQGARIVFTLPAAAGVEAGANGEAPRGEQSGGESDSFGLGSA